jgi:hypothetical protein
MARDPIKQREAAARYDARHPGRRADATRRSQAKRGGYLPPPPESECPPRPADGCCEYCHTPVGVHRLEMDHNHNTGAFRAWACRPCNRRINDRMGPFGEPCFYPKPQRLA